MYHSMEPPTVKAPALPMLSLWWALAVWVAACLLPGGVKPGTDFIGPPSAGLQDRPPVAGAEPGLAPPASSATPRVFWTLPGQGQVRIVIHAPRPDGGQSLDSQGGQGD